jgi:hypothetical protein
MKRSALLVLSLMGGAHAAPYDDLLIALERAQRRILIFAPSLYDVELAEAIRRARLDSIRKVNVRVLSVPFYNYQPGSVMLSLALAGVPVYEAQVPSTGGIIVVDDQGWKGDYLGRFTNTALVPMKAGEINKTLGWFKSSLKGANVLTQVEAFERLKKVTP